MHPVRTGLGLGAAAVAAFSPSALNPVNWYDSTVLSSLTIDGSNNVQSWADLMGSGTTYAQATSGNRPAYVSSGGVNGKASVRGTGAAGQNLGANKTIATIMGSATAAELVVVAKLAADRATSPFGRLFSSSDTDDILQWSDGKTYSGFCASSRNTGNAVTAGIMINPFVWDVQSAAGAFSINVNWVANFTTATNTFTTGAVTPLIIGGSTSQLNGYIAEWMIFSRVLSATDRSALRAYLAAKWGTP